MSILDEPSPFALWRFEEEIKKHGQAIHPVTGILHIGRRWRAAELMDDMELDVPARTDGGGGNGAA